MSDSDIEEVSGSVAAEGKENIGASRGGYTSYDGPFDKKVAEYVSNLLKERDNLDKERYPLIHRLVQNELTSMSKGAVRVNQENGYVDLYGEAPITLYVKAMPPSKMFPKVNYAGRMIGPKGAYLKALMKETMTKMTLLGKGVMKDKNKEDELRRGSDPKYYHLQEDMHMAIMVTAPAPEAYARVAYALKCLREQALSDNQGLEGLHWIANLTRNSRGNAQGPTLQPSFSAGDVEMRPATARYSPPASSQQSLGVSYPPRRASYDSPREQPASGQPPSQTPYFSGPSYMVPRRPAPQPQSESSRAMDYVSKVLHFQPHSNYEGRGNSPGTIPAYEYGHGHSAGAGVILYDHERPQNYYRTGDGPSGGSWSSSDPFALKPTTERVERSSLTSASLPQRYAPY